MTPPPPDEQSGISEALRSAIENTFAASSGSAGQTRERAGELLDEVAKRGREAGWELRRRGQDAGAELKRRGQDASTELRRRGQDAGADVVARIEEELRSISERLAKLESALRSKP